MHWPLQAGTCHVYIIYVFSVESNYEEDVLIRDQN